MEQHTDEQDIRLARLYALPDEQSLMIGTRRYLGVAVVARVLGRSTEGVNLWCRNERVFREVKRTTEKYRPSYLIPFEEVERVIRENDFPRPGNPAFRVGGVYPYPNRRQKRKPAKEVEPEAAILHLSAFQRRKIKRLAYLPETYQVEFAIEHDAPQRSYSLIASIQQAGATCDTKTIIAHSRKSDRSLSDFEVYQDAFDAKCRAVADYYSQCKKEAALQTPAPTII